jgi:hypothetical protein
MSISAALKRGLCSTRNCNQRAISHSLPFPVALYHPRPICCFWNAGTIRKTANGQETLPLKTRPNCLPPLSILTSAGSRMV